MSGFASLFSQSSEEAARKANIVARGDKVLIKSTYDNPEITIPSSDQEGINAGASLEALLDAEEAAEVAQDAPNPKLSTFNRSNKTLPTTFQEFNRGRDKIKALTKSGLDGLASNGRDPTKKILKRFLQERSFLIFEFPSEGGSRSFSILPFFENITISENQKANYAVYDLIGRAGNLYGYTGAKSRQFSLNFKMNVIHIHEMLTKEGFSLQDFSESIVDSTNRDALRELFFKKPNSRTGRSKSNQSATASETFFGLKIEDDPDDLTYADSEFYDPKFPSPETQSRRADDLSLRLAYNTINKFEDAINSVLWWINLVRSSTVNNSNNSIYGPPIIRINHGLLYNNIPCICTNFSIRENSKTTYDVINNFATYYDITMSLEEIRSSSNVYKPNDPIKGDSVAGWNDLQQYGTMDPYNGVWNIRR